MKDRYNLGLKFRRVVTIALRNLPLAIEQDEYRDIGVALNAIAIFAILQPKELTPATAGVTRVYQVGPPLFDGMRLDAQ
jgi:hypothetical protein